MNDSELQAVYRELLRDRAGGRDACPAPEAIIALVERRGSELDRLATLDHVMNCAGCKTDFDVVQAVAAGRPVPSRRFPLPLTMAAGVAVLVSGTLLYSVLRARTAGENVARGAGDAIELISPRGDSHDRPITFTWRKAPGDARYALEVFTPEGDAVYSAEVADTAVVLPARVSLQTGTTYHWWVLVRRSDGGEVRTPPVAFTP